MIDFNDAALAMAAEQAAKRILRAMQFLQEKQRQRTSKPARKLPKDEQYWFTAWHGKAVKVEFEGSKPGEYPRKRGGGGVGGVVYGPTTTKEIIENMLVGRVGQSALSWYMLHLELNKDRLGYIRTAEDFKSEVVALLNGKAS